MQLFNDLLSKKQKCHHKEFDRTHNELLSEVEFFREISMKSETELKLLEKKFLEFQEKVMQKLKSTAHSEISEEDSGIHSKSPNQDTSSESILVQNHSQPSKRKRGKKKRR